MWFDHDEPFDVGETEYDIEDDTEDDLPDMWVAHDQPERPLAYGAWLCDCPTCRHSLEVAATADPGVVIVLKTSADRIVVSVARALREWRESGALEGLLLLSYDYIREVFVGECAPFGWDGEFWSLHQSTARLAKRGRDRRRAKSRG
jgi:hypothetical protein